ncbi:hypothetical protein [Blastopirellula marina]|uniref:Uncharacterized protein n=1 Tax=Blastopirellula marina DSM 3645 TaxID=314230 RepID=A3ZN07_9BACT|nr:hypothetical protein [Blastopirellula marina]EAQ82336.1 hypothetical protein DSM3645_01440 [Blastopirellula marina DSM 3645]
MSKRAVKHLKKYDADCLEQCLHVSLTRYVAAPESVDAQIDLLGAMHQTMWLSNQTDGYLKEFASSANERIERAFDRLLKSPYDDRALRVLSYHTMGELNKQIAELFPHRVFAQIESSTYTIGFCASRSGGGFKDYFELQCETSGELTRLHYVKGLVNRAPDAVNNKYYSNPDAGLVYGPCLTSRYMTVGQPYGYWYEYEGNREFPDESTVSSFIDKVDKWFAKKSR